MTKFIVGPLIFIAGIALIKYTFLVTQITGKIDFAEKYLQSPLNGTYTWWRLVGVAFMIFALLWMAGFLNFGAEIPVPT